MGKDSRKFIRSISVVGDAVSPNAKAFYRFLQEMAFTQALGETYMSDDYEYHRPDLLHVAGTSWKEGCPP